MGEYAAINNIKRVKYMQWGNGSGQTSWRTVVSDGGAPDEQKYQEPGHDMVPPPPSLMYQASAMPFNGDHYWQSEELERAGRPTPLDLSGLDSYQEPSRTETNSDTEHQTTGQDAYMQMDENPGQRDEYYTPHMRRFESIDVHNREAEAYAHASDYTGMQESDFIKKGAHNADATDDCEFKLERRLERYGYNWCCWWMCGWNYRCCCAWYRLVWTHRSRSSHCREHVVAKMVPNGIRGTHVHC